MPDFKVTFRGDLGNLAQFDAAIKNTVSANAKTIDQLNARLSQTLGSTVRSLSSGSGAGLFTTNITRQIDAVNRTFKTTGTTIRRVLTDYENAVDKAGKHTLRPVFDDVYQASFKETLGDLDRYEAVQKRIAPIEQQALAAKERHLQKIIPLENEITGLIEKRTTLEGKLANLQKSNSIPIQGVQAKIASLQAAGPGQGAALIKAQQDLAKLQADAARGEGKLQTAINNTNASIRIREKAIQRLENAYKNLVQPRYANKLNPLYAESQAAQEATPPIQRDLAAALSRSSSLQKSLIGAGLGGGAKYGTEQFKEALAQQEAAVTSYYRNLRTGVTNIQGQFTDSIGKNASGIVQKFTVDLDKNGKVIGRWGGQLAGAGTILRQTVRDFQKVIEWTVATTLVFGTLATVVKQLSSINDLNTSLTRLSITAQTTAEQTKALFEDLGQISIATATPLKDIVKVADDVALATKRAGQSADEWRAQIIALTNAVGVYTNLTGTDTVQATDQLSAAFKQLGIAPQELLGVLSKVTAVTGGQSQAIADIVKSLSGLSEAAKAAGFSLDEQIASIQVLSQVTNKSASEIATAFKNLFGSVSSAGSEKILKQFGISVRDASGGVRDFLAIYRDVADALAKGIIPQNRLPDVLRGIAGGPRRAPDAAALLANLGRIDEVVGTSVNATNEAWIANAKILDTNTAKITQFQNAIDIAIFNTFGKAVEDATATLAGFGTVFAQAFGTINPMLISMVLQLGAVALAGRTLGGIFNNYLIPSVTKGFIPALRGAIGELAAFIALAKSQPLQALKNPGAFTGGIGLKGLGKGAAIAGIAGIAGLTLANQSNGLDVGTIGTALQLGGSVGLAVPGFQAVGAAALIAGTAIQLLATNSQEAKKSSADLEKEIYGLTQNLKDTQLEANNFAKAQKDSLININELKDKTKLTSDEQARLSTETEKYVTATLGLADANKRAADSFQQILDKIPGLSESYSQLKTLFSSGIVQQGSPLLKQLQEQLAKDILKNSGQAIFSGTQGASISPLFAAPRVSTGTNNIQGYGQKINLDDLINNPALIDKIFGPNGIITPKTGTELLGGENLRKLQVALAQLGEQITNGQSTITPERFQVLVDAVQKLAQSADSFSANTVALTQQQAIIQSKQAIGAFTPEQAGNANLASGLASLLNVSGQGYKPVQGPQQGPTISPLQTAQKLISNLYQQADKGQKLTTSELIETGKQVLILTNQYNNLGKISQKAINLGIVDVLKKAGVEGKDLDAIIAQLGVTAQEAAQQAEELATALGAAKQNALQSFADRSLQLLIAKNSGQFKDNAAGLKDLQDQNVAARDSTLALVDSIGKLSGVAFIDLNNALSQIIGLQGDFITGEDFASLSAEEQAKKQSDLATKLIETAVAAGVNADGIKKITAQVGILIGALNAIPPFKTTVVSVQVVGGKINDRLTDSLSAQNQAKADKAAQKSIADAIKQIQKIINSGSGSNLGQLSKAAKRAGSKSGGAANKPGLLDIPQEIIDSSNANALLKEAIRNAKSLQSKVPGETKANKGDIVELLNGTKRVLETRGIGEEYLRRALDELTQQVKRQNDLLSKADTIRRVRVNGGSFAAIANVPVNSQSGVSVGGPNGPVNITLNLNGSILTPAQFAQFADLIAASLKRQLSN